MTKYEIIESTFDYMVWINDRPKESFYTLQQATDFIEWHKQLPPF